ncbi:MAG: threonine synthase [Armatimonadota bacterium]
MAARSWPGVIEHYQRLLPVSDATPRITLLEGNTPLIPSERLGRRLGPGVRLFFKYEGVNPTCSFKDRGMTMAISKAVEEGATATICASTGNTSASAAAYCARAGIQSVVLIPEGHVALGKLAQALAYGARTIAVEGDFDACLRLVREISDSYPVALVNSLNPYRIQGQKTAAFEVCDVLGRAPQFHALPVGNAGNITSYWLGYCEYKQQGVIDRLPHMLGFQAAGAAPIVTGKRVEKPETLATAIRIGNPARWQEAARAIEESDGRIEAVTDEQILEAYRELSGLEGIFCEPASAASYAGLKKLAAEGFFGSRGCTVVATLTGHGLKDPDRALAIAPEPERAPADLGAVVRMLGLD